MITDSELLQLRKEIYLALIAKSGVREWEEPPEIRAAIWTAAIDAADGLLGIDSEPSEGGGSVALPDFWKWKPGTALTLKSSGGTAAMAFASVANVALGSATSTGATQSATLDLADSTGAIPEWLRIDTELEFAATPTANNSCPIFASFWNTTGAGVGNTSGNSSAYTGYSNNVDAALQQLVQIGTHVCTSQATSTVQKCNAGVFRPTGRYMNVVFRNNAGSATHSSDANCLIRITPLDGCLKDEQEA
jgi:hypothetical protein